MYQKTLLDNSIRILTEKLPSRLVSIGIWVDVGSRDENEFNNGSAHFAEHMFFKGTRLRSAQQISKELDMLGGMSNAFTSTEHTCFYATVVDERLAEAVDLLGDIFLNSVLAGEEIEREKQVILQEIAMVEDTPDDRVHELFTALFWEGHSLAQTVLGRPEVVASMDSPRLGEFVRHFYRPDRIVIAAAGNVDHQQFVRLWSKRMGEIVPSQPAPARRLPPAQVSIAASRKVVSRPLEQVHMVMGTAGLPVNSDDRYKLLLLNIILGGNMSSRLFQEIREKRGLAYSVYSYLASNSDSGYAAIYLGVDPGSLSEALALIRQELLKLQKEAIGEDELTGAAAYAKGGVCLAAENMEVRMTSLARDELFFGRHFSLEEITGALDAVTLDDVEQMARQVFGPAEIPLAVIGPVSEEEVNQEFC